MPIEFGELHPDGSYTHIHTLTNEQIGACPFVIFDPSHYREDGTCKCDCATERARMVEEWEYTLDDFREAGIEV